MLRDEEVSKSKRKFDLFDHELVPKHEVLTPEDKEALLKQYGIKPSQLPKILANDPVVLEINAKPGDVIKITRRSPIAGEVISYRFVVEV